MKPRALFQTQRTRLLLHFYEKESVAGWLTRSLSNITVTAALQKGNTYGARVSKRASHTFSKRRHSTSRAWATRQTSLDILLAFLHNTHLAENQRNPNKQKLYNHNTLELTKHSEPAILEIIPNWFSNTFILENPQKHGCPKNGSPTEKKS
jgi:hypothetical protein